MTDPIPNGPEMPAGPIGLHCPGCGELATFRIADGPAFCGKAGCQILSWIPDQTLAEALANFKQIDLRGKSDS